MFNHNTADPIALAAMVKQPAMTMKTRLLHHRLKAGWGVRVQVV